MQDLSREKLLQAAEAEDGMPVSAGGPPLRRLPADRTAANQRPRLSARLQWLPLLGHATAAGAGALVAGALGAVVGVVASHIIISALRPAPLPPN